MLQYSQFTRANALGKDGPHRVYGILGDGFLQKQVIDAISEWGLPPEAREFNFDQLDGETAPLGEVLSLAGNLPFLSDYRAVLVHRAERLDGIFRVTDDAADKTKTKGPSAVKRLAEAVATLPASTVLILARSPETPEPGSRQGTPRCIHATVDKAIEKVGVIINCTLNARDAGQVAAILNNEAARRGIRLARNAAAHLVGRAGNDVAHLMNELEKCSLRAGAQNEVTTAIIDEMTRPAPHETIFDLMAALGARRGAHALGLLRELLRSGEPPPQVLAMLVRHLRQLLQARSFLDAGLQLDGSLAARMPAQLARQLPSEARDNLPAALQAQNWLGRRLAEQARNFSVVQIQQGLRAALETDLALKGIEDDGGSPELLLELLITRMC